jgi:hypothetical protein
MSRPYCASLRFVFHSDREYWDALQTRIEVQSELEGQLQFTSETERYMEEFFPVDSALVKRAFETAISPSDYGTDAERWSQLIHSTTEAGSYTLLVDTATRVTQAIQPSNAIAWMDVSSSGSDVGVEPADGIQPGVVAVWRQQSEAPIRWGNVIFPIETRSDPEDRATGQLQLFTYICEVFREQPNRQFCFGLLIVGSEVEVWLFDHEGGLGCMFDLHKVRTLRFLGQSIPPHFAFGHPESGLLNSNNRIRIFFQSS